MQCSCGGATVDRQAVRSKAGAVLSYRECGACKRCQFDTLEIHGACVATGIAARDAFNRIAEK